MLFFVYVCPPLAVLFMGRPFSAILNCYLTLFGWVPGVKHALVIYGDRKVNKITNRMTKAISEPKWAESLKQQSEGRVTRKRQKVEAVCIDNAHIGMNGTQFRHKR